MKIRINFLLINLFLIGAIHVQAQLCSSNTHSLYFDGVGAHVSFSSDNDLNITDEITVEAWIKSYSWAGSPEGNTIVCKHGWSDGEKGYVLRAGGSGQLSFTIAGVKTNGTNDSWKEIVSAPGALQLNKWHHVAGTFNGSRLRIYIDGVQVGSLNFSGTIANSSPYNLRIGKIAEPTASNPRHFFGLIDEVRIWDESLNSTELSASMNEHITPSQVNDLVGYWRFNDGSGSSVNDLGPANRDGTLEGASWHRDVPFTNGVQRPVISQSGYELESSSLFGNQWNLNGVPISGETSRSFTPQYGGIYSVTVNYGLGCSATSEGFAVFFTAIHDIGEKNEILVYQVDRILHFKIPISFSRDVTMELRNINGKIISRSSFIPDQINLENLSGGVYLLSIYSGDYFFNQKIVIQ